MMDGIDIITKSEIVGANNTLMSLSLAIAAMTFVLLGLCVMSDKFRNKAIGTSIVIISVGFTVSFALMALGMSVFATHTGRYMYAAYIDESVSLTEFYDLYENISRDGDIYTFEDKH